MSSSWQLWSENEVYSAGLCEIEEFYNDNAKGCDCDCDCDVEAEAIDPNGDEDGCEHNGDASSEKNHGLAVNAIQREHDQQQLEQNSSLLIFDPSLQASETPIVPTIESISETHEPIRSSQTSSDSSELTSLTTSPEPPQISPPRPTKHVNADRRELKRRENVIVEVPINVPAKRRRDIHSPVHFSPRRTRQQTRNRKEERVRVTRGQERRRRESHGNISNPYK